jgi:hypothetical protein
MWSVKITGYEPWYGTYKDDYSNLEGQEVEFDATKKGNYWNAGKITAVPGAAKPAGGSKGGGQTYDAEERQMSIVLQSSYKTATEVLSVALANEAVDLGTKKAGRLDVLLGLLDEIAVRIYTNCSAPKDFLGDPEEVAPGPDADDDDWQQK